MDVISQLDEVESLLNGVVSDIERDALDAPTACADFDVAGVLDHMVTGATMFTAAFRGEEPGTVPDDRLAAFRDTITDLFTELRKPGALDGTIQAPFGEVPREVFARFLALDGLVHGWDLARATNQSYEPSDALVADVQAFAEQTLAPLRDGTTFAEPADAPASATPMERLAAFTGRRV